MTYKTVYSLAQQIREIQDLIEVSERNAKTVVGPIMQKAFAVRADKLRAVLATLRGEPQIGVDQ